MTRPESQPHAAAISSDAVRDDLITRYLISLFRANLEAIEKRADIDQNRPEVRAYKEDLLESIFACERRLRSADEH